MTLLSRKPRPQPPDPECGFCRAPMKRDDDPCGCVGWSCPCGDFQTWHCDDHGKLEQDWPPSDVA